MVPQSPRTRKVATVFWAPLNGASEILAFSTLVFPLPMATYFAATAMCASGLSFSVLTKTATAAESASCLIFHVLTDTNATT